MPSTFPVSLAAPAFGVPVEDRARPAVAIAIVRTPAATTAPRFLDNKEFTTLSFFMNTAPVSLSRNRARDTRAGRFGDFGWILHRAGSASGIGFWSSEFLFNHSMNSR